MKWKSWYSLVMNGTASDQTDAFYWQLQSLGGLPNYVN